MNTNEWMTPSDQVLWDIERDPVLRTPVTAISMLERAPNLAVLRARLEAAASSVPRLRQRVVESPAGLAPPRWTDEAPFDLTYHLRRVAAPAPGDTAALLAVVEPLTMAPFDHDRPLWDITVVEGLAGGAAAIVERFHHSFSDGEGAFELAAALFDDAPDAPVQRPGAAASPGDGGAEAPRRLRLTRDALRWRAGWAVRSGWSVVGGMWSFARDARRTAPALVRLLKPSATALSPTMTGRGVGRRVGIFDVSLDGLRRAATAGATTINGAFVAATTEGLRQYHESHGVAPPALRMTMPVSIRDASDAAGGNRFVPLRFDVPLIDADPLTRVRSAGQVCGAWRDDVTMLRLTDAVAAVLAALPAPAVSAVMASMLKGVDFVTTNVAGFRDEVFVAGARVSGQYAFAPPSGAAVNVSLVSHGRLACIGVVADTAAVPDFDSLMAHLETGFRETTLEQQRRAS